MKSITIFMLFIMTLVLSSCSVVGGIFKAGMAWAFILVGLVVALVIFIMVKAKKK